MKKLDLNYLIDDIYKSFYNLVWYNFVYCLFKYVKLIKLILFNVIFYIIKVIFVDFLWRICFVYLFKIIRYDRKINVNF